MLHNMLNKRNLWSVIVATFVSATTLAASNSADYTAAPPFVATSVGKPNVVIALDISGSMKAVAYRDVSAGGWSNNSTVHDDFDPTRRYYGYFDSDSRYRYDTSNGKNFFVADAAGDFDGNFMNWVTMRRMDVVRKVLVGGKVRDRDGETFGGETWYVIQGQNEPEDRTFRKRYSASSAVSPFSDNSVLEIADGVLSVVGSDQGRQVALSESVEVGELSIDRNTRDDPPSGDAEDLNVNSDWVDIPLLNTYVNPVAVVTSISFNGSHPTHARMRRNPDGFGWQIRLEEWDYLDGNHTTEQVGYIVAEATDPLLVTDVNTISVGGVDYEIRAFSRNISRSHQNTADPFDNVFYFNNGYTPVVMAGVASMESAQPVVVRMRNIGASGLEAALQSEESFTGGHPVAELVNFVLIEPVSGIIDSSGVPIEAGVTGVSVNENFSTITYAGGPGFFSGSPILSLNMQTTEGYNTAYARFNTNEANSFRVFIEEETSADSEVEHINESIGYFAVDAISGFRIQVGLEEEPTGVIQQNAGSLRFGMAVYNYDHSRNPTSIYNGNQVNGGTFWPCYPDMSLPVVERTNYDICLQTHVKSPLSNIVDVIEDHPLIWGTTPIAETLYDIKGYFGQIDHNINGHTQWYDNGTEASSGIAPDGHPRRRNSYEVNNDWDPFYYDEYGAVIPCAKSFVLHFNDGEPYRDFDGASSLHPPLVSDGIGSSGPQEALDDLALMLRQQDCRTELGMEGHQDIISYYVYAALGEDEAFDSGTRKMREAAINGGFVDADEDRQPDPPHPSDVNNYILNNSCGGETSEWDSDGDCAPDNFYFANDGERLVEQLNAAFNDIVTRAATGGASSVIAASRSGEGSVVNAIFRPFISAGEDQVAWVGDVHALMVDDAGNIRQDDGDRILESPTADPYIDMCTNEAESTVRAKLSSSLDTKPTAAQFEACSAQVFTLDLFDIEYLWSGANWLSSMTDEQATEQRLYSSTNPGRYIISGVDSNGDGLIRNNEAVSFLPGSFTPSEAGLLADSESEAHDLINWVRGQDIDGLRSRQLDGQTLRLGDIVYSTPTIVGRPNENLDLLYQSTSYREFFDRYRNRRQVIYAGGNDGMLHAFNGGWYDAESKQFLGAQGVSPGSTANYDLGAELWAYAPYNGLPHLEYLADPGYGAVSSDHLYFMDLKPRIFDAKIFPDDEDHPGGWGTVLVVGMRLGGGETTVDIDVDATATDNRTLQSSYTIFDITNPDNPPELLIEFTHPDLGFTTAIPAPVVRGSDNEGNGDWYLMLGSGADTNASGFASVRSQQNARLFLLDLKAIVAGSANVMVNDFGTAGVYTLPDANSFVSDLMAVDFGLDNFTTDSVYFGTVSGQEGNWGGKLYRFVIQADTDDIPNPVSTWNAMEMYNPGRPITAAATVATDPLRNHWVYFGTGRYFTAADSLDNSVNYYFGVKEVRDTSGQFTFESVDSSRVVDISNVQVQTADSILNPAPVLSPALEENATVVDLQKRFWAYDSEEEYVSGWRRTFEAGERNFGAATLIAGTLTYTTYDPMFDECTIDGDAYLYVVNAFTGTASSQPIITQDPDASNNEFVIDIGSSPATSPSLHKGEGYTTDNKATAIIQTANGNIITVEQEYTEKVRDGEASWRQID